MYYKEDQLFYWFNFDIFLVYTHTNRDNNNKKPDFYYKILYEITMIYS